jgi:NADPH:quinone reductase-like Zn-dependent oxidoreductase
MNKLKLTLLRNSTPREIMTSTRKAVIHKTPGVAEIASIPYPESRADYIVVKTKAVALNPTDWKSLESRFIEGVVAGCDYAGVVEEVGSAVTNDLKVGDRVAGFVAGGEYRMISSARFV